jgi:CDP-diacylglycerol pyrophosphatase
MDCMRPDVAIALAAQKKMLADQWEDLPALLHGHRYRARLIEDGTLEHTGPFKILFADVKRRGESMADETLLLTGTTLSDGKPGFILLKDHVQSGDHASVEELLDHSCGVRQH